MTTVIFTRGIRNIRRKNYKRIENYLRSNRYVSLGGTVTAEHGIGKVKHPFLEVMLGKEGIEELRKFKLSLDPSNILGRDNMFKAKTMN